MNLKSLPDATRIAILSAWRGRARGAAVFSGVFLASLVITTVLAYGAGLMSLFLTTAVEYEEYDYRVEMHYPMDGKNRTTDVFAFESICEDILLIDGATDCSITAGLQGRHTESFWGRDVPQQTLELMSIDGPDSNWTNIDLSCAECDDNGPPTNGYRAVRMIGAEAYDGPMYERHSQRVISGEWPTSGADAVNNRSVVIPASIANSAQVDVGDTFSVFNFTYNSNSTLPCEEVDADGNPKEATGFFQSAYGFENEYDFCRVTISLDDLTVAAIFDDRSYSSPLISNQPVYVPWNLLTSEQMVELMAGDHTYRAVTFDRLQLDTSSTSAAESDLRSWKNQIDGYYDSDNDGVDDIRIRGVDMIGSVISFLQILLYFVQAFDYIIMIPIIFLSLSVLIYGLILSLEQRRKEIAVNRVMGASSKGLTRMVLAEMTVISTTAWFAGYLIAIFAVPFILSSDGFMQFDVSWSDCLGLSNGECNLVDMPSLTLKSTILTAVLTIGISVGFSFYRTRDFLRTEISEGVAMVSKAGRSWFWLHMLVFLVGLIALLDYYFDKSSSVDYNLISNAILDGLMTVFGPFFLWIGGALVLAKLGAKGPQLMQLLLSKTPLIKDIKRGISGSGSAEGVGRLAFIIVLTLSIVTMAAVQGYTGTAVDKKSADLSVGSDLQVTFANPMNESEAISVVSQAWIEGDSNLNPEINAATVISLFASLSDDEFNFVTVWVVTDEAVDVLHWSNQALPGNDYRTSLDLLKQEGTFTHGSSSKFQLDVSTGNTYSFDMVTNPFTGETTSKSLVDLGQHSWVPGMSSNVAENVIFIGESTARSWLNNSPFISDDNIQSSTWFFSLEGLLEEKDGENLEQLSILLSTNEQVSSVTDWSTSHDEVSKSGGLIFGTPGLLSLQFVVSAMAAVASSFVFLSLVLNQRRKELSILQAIGASPSQVMRLVLFEILSITIVSMLLGGLLGIGISYGFNGLFNLFGLIFQSFGGAGTPIDRDLIWPILELFQVGGLLLLFVLVALLATTRKAISADLATVLKGE